jgi:hypothetical protein
VNQNQLLFEMAKHNFSNYLVRNFDIVTDQDANGICRMLISGFLNYDEARQYARGLHNVEGQLSTLLRACRHLIVSEDNLRLLGTSYSYRDYELFFEKEIEPVEISTRPLLEEIIIQEEEDAEESQEPKANGQQPQTGNDLPDDPIFNDGPVQQQNNFPDFDEDFW